MLRTDGPALSQPPRDARYRFTHLVSRARVGEANEAAAVDRIEIDARRRRHMLLLQHAAGKFETVGGKIRNIGVEVKGTVRRQELGEAGLRESLDQDGRYS